MNRYFLPLFLVTLSFAQLSRAQSVEAGTAKQPARPPQKSNVRPKSPAPNAEPFDAATIEKMNQQCVTLRTEAGDVVLEMLATTAPDTVRNFLNLAGVGAYDTTTFSRVVKGFIIQGGDLATHSNLTPALSARASRTIHDEPNPVKHTRGIVSMARAAEPNSATTNFFILVGEAPHLDGTFAAFARVRSGMETVEAINNQPATNEKPEKPVRILRAIVAPCAPASSQ